MRRLALLAALGATLLIVPGCARWTLRPLHASRSADTGEAPARLGTLAALMHSQAAPPTGTAATETHDPAIERKPDEGLDKMPPELAIARLSERQGDDEQSQRLYLAFIAKHPQHPLPHHRLGVIAARNSKLDEGEQHLHRALEIAPPSVELLSDMGYLCYLQSRFDEAEHYLLLALEQAPDSASATNNLALVYGARGDFDKSLRYFRRVNDDAKSHANVAFTMTQQGRLEDARNEYLHALTIDKSLRSAANALVQIEQTRKAAEQAAKRRGDQPDALQGRDDVIELSSNAAPQRPQASPEIEVVAKPQPAPPAFQPQPRLASETEETPRSVAAMAQLPFAASKRDALAERLMPLPALPDEPSEAFDAVPVAANKESIFVPVAPLPQPEREISPLPSDRPVASIRPHSRFSHHIAPPPAPAASQFAQVDEPARSSANTSSVFAEARQVNWNDSAPLDAKKPAPRNFSVIPIPTAQPSAESASGQVQQALAVQPTGPAKSAVRPAAVQLGLSDDTVAPAAKTQPVRTQFSDFGAAPARLSTTVGAAPLGSQR